MGQSASAVYGYGAIFETDQKEELYQTFQEDVEWSDIYALQEHLNEYFAQKGTRFEVGGYMPEGELSVLYLICDGYAEGRWASSVDKPAITKAQVTSVQKTLDSLELETPVEPSWILVASWG